MEPLTGGLRLGRCIGQRANGNRPFWQCGAAECPPSGDLAVLPLPEVVRLPAAATGVIHRRIPAGPARLLKACVQGCNQCSLGCVGRAFDIEGCARRSSADVVRNSLGWQWKGQGNRITVNGLAIPSGRIADCYCGRDGTRRRSVHATGASATGCIGQSDETAQTHDSSYESRRDASYMAQMWHVNTLPQQFDVVHSEAPGLPICRGKCNHILIPSCLECVMN